MRADASKLQLPVCCTVCCLLQVVVDEAHHSVATTYRTVLQGLGFIEEVQPERRKNTMTAGSSTGSSSSTANTLSAADSFDDGSDSDSDSDSDTARPGRSSPSEEHKPLVRVLPDPNRLLLGFSATPYRVKVSESRHLYDIFNITYTRSIADMIRTGYLTEVSLV